MNPTLDHHLAGRPLAYLITFRCYGTWLPGDSRVWIDRRSTTCQTPYWAENQRLRKWAINQLNQPAGFLDKPARQTIQTAISEVCQHRQWELLALHTGINHVHAVVNAGVPPETILNTFKSWSTRHLRSRGLMPPDYRAWSRQGSTVYLWNPQSVARACQYVLEGQAEKGDGPLPHGRGTET